MAKTKNPETQGASPGGLTIRKLNRSVRGRRGRCRLRWCGRSGCVRCWFSGRAASGAGVAGAAGAIASGAASLVRESPGPPDHGRSGFWCRCFVPGANMKYAITAARKRCRDDYTVAGSTDLNIRNVIDARILVCGLKARVNSGNGRGWVQRIVQPGIRGLRIQSTCSFGHGELLDLDADRSGNA